MIVGQVFILPVQIPHEPGHGQVENLPHKQQQPDGQDAVGLWWKKSASENYFVAASKTANGLMRKTFCSIVSFSP